MDSSHTLNTSLYGYQTYDYIGYDHIKDVQEQQMMQPMQPVQPVQPLQSVNQVQPIQPIQPIQPQLQPPPIRTHPYPDQYPDPTMEPVIEPLPTAVVIMIFIFAVLWLFSGIAAFVMSLMCFGYSGTAAQHVIGLLIALFFGPFYWIYYFFVKSYCGVKSSTRPKPPRRR